MCPAFCGEFVPETNNIVCMGKIVCPAFCGEFENSKVMDLPSVVCKAIWAIRAFSFSSRRTSLIPTHCRIMRSSRCRVIKSHSIMITLDMHIVAAHASSDVFCLEQTRFAGGVRGKCSYIPGLLSDGHLRCVPSWF